MPDERPDPLADLFTLFAAPLSGTVRSIEQFRKGVDEFLKGVENFNRTMENLNETTERINSLLVDVEQPIRAAIPQVTRTVKTADEMMQAVSGPAMAVAPGLHRLAETLATPAFAQLPNQIGAFSDVLAEVSRRLAPLSQMAESAGGLFGGFRLPGSRPPSAAPAAVPATDEPDEARQPTLTVSRAGMAAAKQPAETSVRKQTPTKKTGARRSAAKKAGAKKPAAKKAGARKAGAKKSAAKKAGSKKTGAQRSVAKKQTAAEQSSAEGSAASD